MRMAKIKIEVPADDTISLLNFAAALSAIAHEKRTGKKVPDETPTPTPDAQGVAAAPTPTPDAQGVAAAPTPTPDAQGVAAAVNAGVVLDSENIPWDSRIHSKGKTTTAKGTWRLKKCPPDQTKDGFAKFVDDVKVELKTVMTNASTPTIDTSTIGFGVAPDAPAPAPDAPAPAPTTFAEIMPLIAGLCASKRTTQDRVNTILLQHGISGMPILAAAGAAKIPEVWADIKRDAETNNG